MPEAPEQITPKRLGDYLDVMSKAVFQSGISWKVVEAKWPDTREAFRNFDAKKVASMSERDIDALAQDTRVIRNRRKLEAIVTNAGRMLELETEHGSFKRYLQAHDDFDATVAALRKDFKFMGEMGCYYFLYVVGEPVPPHEEWQASRQQAAPRKAAARAPRKR
ncbi:MAG: DNA-3-methyladenine glycosylase I [Dehalococcoidia bacterium]